MFGVVGRGKDMTLSWSLGNGLDKICGWWLFPIFCCKMFPLFPENIACGNTGTWMPWETLLMLVEPVLLLGPVLLCWLPFCWVLEERRNVLLEFST